MRFIQSLKTSQRKLIRSKKYCIHHCLPLMLGRSNEGVCQSVCFARVMALYNNFYNKSRFALKLRKSQIFQPIRNVCFTIIKALLCYPNANVQYDTLDVKFLYLLPHHKTVEIQFWIPCIFTMPMLHMIFKTSWVIIRLDTSLLYICKDDPCHLVRMELVIISLVSVNF